MPVHTPHWTQFLTCLICFNDFDTNFRRPITLGCGHTLCKSCLLKLQQKQCPFDKIFIHSCIKDLPENYALLQLVGGKMPAKTETCVSMIPEGDLKFYLTSRKCVEELALYLRESFTTTSSNTSASVLSKPMQKKLIGLVNCQLVEGDGRIRAMRATRSLGERSVTELLLQHQNALQLSANLWASVRVRGGQFLGPAMQEEVLKLVLLALEDGSALCRKVLIMFVVQRLAPHFPHASKTSIGHVVQLLYRASCFKVSKREGDSSLMELKDEFRTYEALRWEHDAQIVQIATEAGLRITPEQWSSLLYGDAAHKSHMQSIIDKLQTPQSFSQSVQELVIALQRTGDPGNLSQLRPQYELLASLDSSQDASPPLWRDLQCALEATRLIMKGLVEFMLNFRCRKTPDERPGANAKYKTSMCRSLTLKGSCYHGINCIFAHSHEEMEMHRAKSKKKSRNSSPQLLQNSSFPADCDISHISEEIPDLPQCSSADELNVVNISHAYEHQIPIINFNSSCPQIPGPVSMLLPVPTSVSLSRESDFSSYIHVEHNLNLEHPSFPQAMTKSKSPSLAELHRRKEEIIAQLQNSDSGLDIPYAYSVKNDAIEHNYMPEALNTGFSVPRIPTLVPLYSKPCDTNSIFAQSASASNFMPVQVDDEKLANWCQSEADLEKDDEFIPFDPPFESKYGPISRCLRKPMEYSSSFPMSETKHNSPEIPHNNGQRVINSDSPPKGASAAEQFSFKKEKSNDYL